MLLVPGVVVEAVVYASQRHENVVRRSSLSLVSLLAELAQEAATLVAVGNGASVVGAQVAADTLRGGSGEGKAVTDRAASGGLSRNGVLEARRTNHVLARQILHIRAMATARVALLHRYR